MGVKAVLRIAAYSNKKFKFNPIQQVLFKGIARSEGAEGAAALSGILQRQKNNFKTKMLIP